MAHIRDTKWLTLEVCREFQRGTCSRSDQECKFAHPAKSCQVDNGRVIACFDSLKVRKEKGSEWEVWGSDLRQRTDKSGAVPESSVRDVSPGRVVVVLFFFLCLSVCLKITGQNR